MKVPFKPSMLKIRRKPAKWIILHHSSEMYERPDAMIDNSKFQTNALSAGVMEKKQGDINYHYIIDKIQDDYMAIACTPFVYLCEWDDIHADINNVAIHIALLGNYDMKIPEKRCYEILAYRLLNPMLKMFAISPARIKLHNEVSDDKELTCPGDFVNKEVVISMVRRFVIK